MFFSSDFVRRARDFFEDLPATRLVLERSSYNILFVAQGVFVTFFVRENRNSREPA